MFDFTRLPNYSAPKGMKPVLIRAMDGTFGWVTMTEEEAEKFPFYMVDILEHTKILDKDGKVVGRLMR